jgi:hypothetical protein
MTYHEAERKRHVQETHEAERTRQVHQCAVNVLSSLSNVLSSMNNAAPEKGLQMLSNPTLMGSIFNQWYETTRERFEDFTQNGEACCNCATSSLYDFTLPADAGQLARAKGVIDEARDFVLSIPQSVLTLPDNDALSNAETYIRQLA